MLIIIINYCSNCEVLVYFKLQLTDQESVSCTDFINKKSRKPDITQGAVPFFDIILFKRNEFSEQPVNTLRTICRLNNVKLSVQNVKTKNGIL